MTGVRVRETVPDTFLDRADEIVNVDVTVEELHTRLRQGKVYRPEKVEQALSNFFKETNISTLRELALRAVADEIGEKAASRRQREGLEPALIPERGDGVHELERRRAEGPAAGRTHRRTYGWALVRRLRRDPRASGRHIRPGQRGLRCSAISRWRRNLGATVVRVTADRPADGLIALPTRRITPCLRPDRAHSMEILMKGSTLNRSWKKSRDRRSGGASRG